jgi:hypothetical protein
MLSYACLMASQSCKLYSRRNQKILNVITFAERIIHFNRQLTYTGSPLPEGIGIMNPFRGSEERMDIVETFYHKFYNDYHSRNIILGINPGRFGGGLTGIPFTDPKRLNAACHIEYKGKITHEPSSVFVYEVIKAYGGVEAFYGDFYINSVCPLGFTSADRKGKEKNYNYYDSRDLMQAVYNFIVDNIRKQISLGIKTDVCICLGTGKNEKFLRGINDKYMFFKEIISLEHPRYIMQYKSGSRAFYIDKYISVFKKYL